MNLQDFKKQQLAEKIHQMKTMNLSSGEIQKSFDSEELDLINKAIDNNIEKGKAAHRENYTR